jgi:hypothetical protein
MVRRTLAQAPKLAADFPVRPEAMPPAALGSIHSKLIVAALLWGSHGLKFPF